MTRVEPARRAETCRRRADFFLTTAGVILYVAILGGIIGAVFEFARWLQSGKWDPVTIWPLARMVIDSDWLSAPTSWLGLHKIVVWCLDLPLFLTGPALAVAIGSGVCASIASDYQQESDRIEHQKHDLVEE